MKKQELNYIQELEIKGLWGLYNVNLDLKPDVNIIVGDNGTGKSTLLMILKMITGLPIDLITQKSFEAKNIHVNWVTALGKKPFEGKIKQETPKFSLQPKIKMFGITDNPTMF